jgi:CTP:phosphocholine cytidylyltransferase-like protein
LCVRERERESVYERERESVCEREMVCVCARDSVIESVRVVGHENYTMMSSKHKRTTSINPSIN